LSSTGQRNTFIEHFCWTTKVQRLSRPLVQSESGPVQVGLREDDEVNRPGFNGDLALLNVLIGAAGFRLSRR